MFGFDLGSSEKNPTAMAARCTEVVNYSEIDHFSAALVGGSTRPVPAGSRQFSASLATFRLGDTVLQAGRCTPVVMVGEISTDVVCIVLPLQWRMAFRLNGRAVGPGDFGVYGSAADLLGACHDDLAWAELRLVQEQGNDAAGHIPGCRIDPARTVRWLRRPGASASFCYGFDRANRCEANRRPAT